MSAKVDHSMPGCDKVLLVQAELDGELDAAQAAALEAHRADCSICQAAQTELLRARELLRGEAYETTPDDMRARVMARLRQAEPRPPPALAAGSGSFPRSAASVSARPAPPRSRSWLYCRSGAISPTSSSPAISGRCSPATSKTWSRPTSTRSSRGSTAASISRRR